MEPTTTALVIGSGMCALATAQVLSRHFERVTVIERDDPVALQQQHCALYAARLANSARPGVQQYNQLHAMTSKGLQLYDKLFDGRFTENLKASGGNFCNALESGIIHHPNSGVLPWKRHLPAKEPIPLAFCSRHLCESTTRKLVTENPKVHFLYGATVASLVFAGGEVAGGAGDKPVHAKTVTGVRLSDGSTLTAQLVVDCSGRGSNLPAWLAAAGYPRPRTTRASADSGYTAWLCKLAPEVEQVLDDNNTQYIVTLAAPPDCVTASLIQRIEGGLCMASLGGNEGRYPPGTDHEELMRFAREEVWHPSAGRLLAGCTFLAPVNHSHDLTSTWRHYEDMSLWPDGLLVMGDAICSFNPTYGQGMTVAVQEATELGRLLSARAPAAGCSGGATAAPAGSAEGLAAKQKGAGLASAAHIDSSGRDLASQSDQLPRPATPTPASTTSSGGSSTAWLAGLNQDFQQAARPHIKAAWDMAVGTDMRFKGSTINEPYSRGLMERLAVGYMVQLFSLAATDTVVAGALHRLFAMLDGPEALLHPAILLRYLCHKLVQHMPGPLRQLLKPWGMGGSSNCVGSGGGGDVGKVGGGDREVALAQLMGWDTA